jgi:hypothetical protein
MNIEYSLFDISLTVENILQYTPPGAGFLILRFVHQWNAICIFIIPPLQKRYVFLNKKIPNYEYTHKIHDKQHGRQ